MADTWYGRGSPQSHPTPAKILQSHDRVKTNSCLVPIPEEWLQSHSHVVVLLLGQIVFSHLLLNVLGDQGHTVSSGPVTHTPSEQQRVRCVCTCACCAQLHTTWYLRLALPSWLRELFCPPGPALLIVICFFLLYFTMFCTFKTAGLYSMSISLHLQVKFMVCECEKWFGRICGTGKIQRFTKLWP